MPRINLIIVEGVLIILLVLFSGFLVYRNQSLIREIEKTRQTPQPTAIVTSSPSPSPSPEVSPSGAVKPSLKPSSSPLPINTFAP